ncbi:MAG: protein NosL [Deltaproteobacteria bacterium]|nr:protein NosL [Deltaproteobacteria bacterium]
MKRSLHAARIATALLLLAACGVEPDSGPGKVSWDRDTCERCQMAISDRSFATQLRTTDGHLHRFDDVGCALIWERDQDADVTEVWVRELEGDAWLDGHDARFVKVRNSPMGYGYGARSTAPEGLDLMKLREQILVMEDERRHPAQ